MDFKTGKDKENKSETRKRELLKSEIQKNQEYTVVVTGMTHEGLGVARTGGFVVFIKDAISGETVSIRIIKVNKSYAVGKLLKILKESEARCEPFCSVFKGCGGCTLQHMSYPKQLKFKEDLVRDALERVGGLGRVKQQGDLADKSVENSTVKNSIVKNSAGTTEVSEGSSANIKDINSIIKPIIGMKKPFNYRNKAQYPVQMVDGKIRIGFFSRRSHDVVESGECRIQDEISEKAKEAVRRFLESNAISIFDDATGKGLVRHVVIRKGFVTGEVMVVLVINGRDLPCKDMLTGILRNEIPGLKSVILNINRQKTNVILGEQNVTIYGSDYITDKIGRFEFIISPNSFFQVNPVQTEVLYAKALEYAGLKQGKANDTAKTVFDIYCGVGTISLFLSQAAKHVYGIESVPEAIEDAKRNAKLNGVKNVTFIEGRAEEAVKELYLKGISADVVVVDPPRKGCDESVLETMISMQPERIVYVSCNPSTLARDIRYLADRGYKTEEVQPVDMFPWTEHVETVVLITRVEK